MRDVILFSLGFGCATLPLVSAQPVSRPRIEWQQTLGGMSYDAPVKIVETPDGGFVIGGISFSDAGGN
jgi:hypothetical protein